MWAPETLPKVSGVEYRVVPEHDGYIAGNDGSVWSCWHYLSRPYYRHEISNQWKQLKGIPIRHGRKRVTLRNAVGGYRVVFISHVVLEAFVGPRPLGLICCHEDDDCTNDKLSNIRWGTEESNIADRQRNGGYKVGQKLDMRKLNESDISHVRVMKLFGSTLQHIAETFNVSVYTISKALKY